MQMQVKFDYGFPIDRLKKKIKVSDLSSVLDFKISCKHYINISNYYVFNSKETLLGLEGTLMRGGGGEVGALNFVSLLSRA